jgi:hypothetical protein
MPGFDRTGPRGEGPLTGRGAGVCYPFDRPPTFEFPPLGVRPRWGLRANLQGGMGRGRRNRGRRY